MNATEQWEYNHGSKVLSPGYICDGAKTVFTRGQCHTFALAMSRICETEGVSHLLVGTGADPDCPSHCAVYIPSLDLVVDVEGGASPDQKTEWGPPYWLDKPSTVGKYWAEWGIAWPNWIEDYDWYDFEPDPDRALPYAQTRFEKSIVPQLAKL